MIAFTCASYIQLMRAFQMHMCMEEYNEEADLFLVYPMFKKENMIERIRNTKVFRSVYYIDASIEGHFRLFRTKLLFDREIGKDNIYSKLISFNIENLIACFIYNRCKKLPGFEFHLCEDGPTVYKFYIPNENRKIDPYKLMRLDRECFHIKKFWSSFPDLVDIPGVFTTTIQKMPPIHIDNLELLNTLNYVFNYKNIQELDNTDLLIMEESHYTDGLLPDNYDYLLYKKIRQRYKNKNIFIKLHPRTANNRFDGCIDLLPSSSMPWELIAWNRIKSNPKPLLQIGISCSTLISDKALFDYEGPKIALMKMFKNRIKPTEGMYRVDDEIIRTHEIIKGTFRSPENFVMPENEREVFDALDKLMCIDTRTYHE